MSDNKFIVKKIVLNSSGIIKLLQSREIMDELEKVAVDQYGEIESSYVGFDRCHVICKDTGG